MILKQTEILSNDGENVTQINKDCISANCTSESTQMCVQSKDTGQMVLVSLHCTI